MISLSGLVEKIDDRINPITVKEMRQVVRGKFFWGILILFLGFQCVVLSLSLADGAASRGNSGSEALGFLFGILMLGCFAIIPLYSGFRFAKERSENNEELLYITTITPFSIIWGKFTAAFAFILLIFSAFAPFMAMTFFLKGVDMPLMFLILGLCLLICAVATIFQLALGSLARDGNIFNVLRGIGLFVQISFFFTVASMVAEALRYGGARFFGVANTLGGILTFIFLLAGLASFLFLAAAAVVSPPTSNKMKPVRGFLTIFWFLSFCVAYYWSTQSFHSPLISGWGIMSIFAINFMMIVSVCERENLTARVARNVSKTFLKNRLDFIFSSGSAGGIVWCLLMLVATIIVVSLFPSASSLRVHNEFYKVAFGFSAYIFAYGMLGSFIRRVFLADFVKCTNTWVIVLVTCMVFALGPLFLGIFFGSGNEFMMIGNPMSVFSYRFNDLSAVFAFTLAIISLILNIPWIFRQLKQYSDLLKNNANNLPMRIEHEK
jgi:hypothetical protein